MLAKMVRGKLCWLTREMQEYESVVTLTSLNLRYAVKI